MASETSEAAGSEGPAALAPLLEVLAFFFGGMALTKIDLS